MKPDQPAHVLSIGSGLAAEAGGVGGETKGKLLALEDLPGAQVRQRNLGRGDQMKVVPFDVKQVVSEPGKLPGSEQSSGVDEERRDHLQVTMLARVQVEHEADQGALQQRARSAYHGEAGAADLCRSLEVEDAKLLPQLDMMARSESKAPWLPPDAHDLVVGAVLPDRHARMRNVGDLVQERADGLLDHTQLAVELLDAIVQLPHLLLARFGLRLAAILHQAADLLRSEVLGMLELLRLGDQAASVHVEPGELIQGHFHPAVAKPPRDRLQVVTEDGGIQHGPGRKGG